MIARRTFIHAAGAMAAGALGRGVIALPTTGASGSAGPRRRANDLKLELSPSRVFKTTADFNRDRVESWYCYLRLTNTVAEPVEIERLVVVQRKGTADLVIETYDGVGATALDLTPGSPSGASAPFSVALLRLASTQPLTLALDAVRVEVTVRQSGGEINGLVREFPLETYVQRTKLVFPFRGRGIITQGGASNNGHRNRSGMFAVDALGLTDMYGTMVKAGDTPDCLAGWGRPIVAPAAGVVVVARGDRPDQPAIGIADPKYFVREFPDGGDPGNHVVIDHGSGEFSMIAHLKEGTLAVSVGQRVEQGHRLGLLGNSGDSTAPHVHHQLQTGPHWRAADGLPHVYENGPGRRHDRGWMFNAR